LQNQSKIILTFYQKDLVPILKGRDFYVYYMTKFNTYTYVTCVHFGTIAFCKCERNSNRSINFKVSPLFIICFHTSS
jgi:hypothetical protein